jgi:hypothetical protein
MTGPTTAAQASVAESFAAATRKAPFVRPPHVTRVARARAVAAPDPGDAPAVLASTPVEAGDRPTLLHPVTYLCANCAGRFPARNRPTPYCSPQCTAEAKAVRYARKQRAEHGDDLPMPVRVMLHRKIVHALTECAYDKWSGLPEPDPVTPPAVHPLADHVDQRIPASDTYAVKAQQLKVRSLSENVLLACDHQNWDSVWRAWVNAHAR